MRTRYLNRKILIIQQHPQTPNLIAFFNELLLQITSVSNNYRETVIAYIVALCSIYLLIKDGDNLAKVGILNEINKERIKKVNNN